MNSILSKRRILLNTLLVLIIIWLLNTIKQEHEHFKPRETTVTKEAQTLLCIIVLDQVDFNNVKIIYDTWASNCNNHVFISNALSEDREHFSSYNLNVVKPRKLTNFASIQSTSNTFATFEEVFLRYNNYDWYLKVHEDTFIFVDNLRQFIASKSAFMPLIYGYKKGGHLVSSAAGYVLSRKALQRLGTHLVKSFSSNQCRNTAHEDADLTQCLEALGIAAEASVDDKGLQRFYPYSLNTLKYYFPKYRIQKELKCCSDETISLSYTDQSDMEKFRSILNEYHANKEHMVFKDFYTKYTNIRAPKQEQQQKTFSFTKELLILCFVYAFVICLYKFARTCSSIFFSNSYKKEMSSL